MSKTAKLQIRKNKPPTKDKQPLKQLKIANQKKEQNLSSHKKPDKTTNQNNWQNLNPIKTNNYFFSTKNQKSTMDHYITHYSLIFPLSTLLMLLTCFNHCML